MRPRLARRPASLVLLAGVALAGCGGDGDPQAGPSTSAAEASPSTSAAPASPTAEPSPPPSGPDRSPEALAALVEFDAPRFEDPQVRAAVEGYREFVTQLVVAQGLADPDHPPLLATIEPQFVDEALGNTRSNIENGAYLLGPRTDTVVDGVVSGGRVLLTACADLGSRVAYFLADDTVARPAQPNVAPADVTMVRAAQGWVVSGYARNEELTCP